jgi:hypothetical protein
MSMKIISSALDSNYGRVGTLNILMKSAHSRKRVGLHLPLTLLAALVLAMSRLALAATSARELRKVERRSGV